MSANMPAGSRWRAVAALFSDGCLRTQLTRIIGLLLLIQAVMAASLLLGAISTQRSMATLVLDRMEPINDLQAMAGAYANALATAQKVRSGLMSRSSGLSTVAIAQADAREHWAQFRSHHVADKHAGRVAAIGDAIGDADEACRKLGLILRGGSDDALDFFAGGQLYGAVDPLISASRGLVDELRKDAAVEKEALDWAFARNLIIAGLLLAASIAAGWWGLRATMRRISGPLGAIAGVTRRIGDPDDATPIPGLDRRDEIGTIARALLFAREQGAEARRLAQEARRIEERAHADEMAAHRARDERAVALDTVFASFDSDLGRIVSGLAELAAGMRASAAEIADRASHAESNALASAALGEQTAASIGRISDSGDALARSIEAVGGEARDARERVGAVRGKADESRIEAERLEQVVAEVSGVLDMITTVANKTNLLAINASIEAARAGPSGSGFAVVANEVKALAGQTRQAALRITTRLDEIGGAARGVCDSIREIDRLVRETDDAARRISGSVDEQGVATRAIALAVSQAAEGSSEAARSVAAVLERAEAARTDSGKLLAVADGIADQADYLHREIFRLLERVRAA